MLVDSLALGDFQAWFRLHLVNWPDSNIMNKIMVYTCFYSVLR